jgi:hypothetical protein
MNRELARAGYFLSHRILRQEERHRAFRDPTMRKVSQERAEKALLDAPRNSSHLFTPRCPRVPRERVPRSALSTSVRARERYESI